MYRHGDNMAIVRVIEGAVESCVVTGDIDDLKGGKQTLIELFIVYRQIMRAKGLPIQQCRWKMSKDGTEFTFKMGVESNG